MGKLSRSFTCDLDVLAWLEQYAIKQHKKQSYIVNSVLRDTMRLDQTWKCSICDALNHIDNKTCFTLTDGVFCKGVKA